MKNPEPPPHRGTSFGVRASADHRLDVSLAPNVRVIVRPPPGDWHFVIHNEILCKHSEFFESEIGENWEAEEKCVRLEDEDPNAFDMFASFIYTGRVHSWVDWDILYERPDREWGRLLRAWRLADQLRSTSFKDALVDTMCEKMLQEKKYPTILYVEAYSHTSAVKEDTRYATTLYAEAYRRTSAGAPLRRLAVDIAVWRWSAKAYELVPFDESRDEFFHDIAVRRQELSPEELKGRPPFLSPSCRYDEHIDGDDGDDEDGEDGEHGEEGEGDDGESDDGEDVKEIPYYRTTF